MPQEATELLSMLYISVMYIYMYFVAYVTSLTLKICRHRKFSLTGSNLQEGTPNVNTFWGQGVLKMFN